MSGYSDAPTPEPIDYNAKLEQIIADVRYNEITSKQAVAAISALLVSARKQGYDEGYAVQLRKDNEFIKYIQTEARKDELELYKWHRPNHGLMPDFDYMHDRLAELSKSKEGGV